MRETADRLGALLGEPNIGRVLFVHAHPDDETLQTGPLIAELVSRNVAVAVVTCTRGEQGESLERVDDLVTHRAAELQAALETLGATEHYWLGTPPARVGAPRRYTDSGMRWVTESVAGPAQLDDPNTFTAASVAEAAADLTALMVNSNTDLVVGYDRGGSYGHPDHVRAFAVTREAATRAGIPRIEVASDPAQPGFEYFSLPEHTQQIVRALACYRSQLTLTEGRIRHVGGQYQDIPNVVGLRRIPTDKPE